MFIYLCTNAACGQLDVPKTSDYAFPDGVIVYCGECSEPCDGPVDDTEPDPDPA